MKEQKETKTLCHVRRFAIPMMVRGVSHAELGSVSAGRVKQSFILMFFLTSLFDWAKSKQKPHHEKQILIFPTHHPALQWQENKYFTLFVDNNRTCTGLVVS